VEKMKDLAPTILEDIINRLILITQNQKKIMDELGIEDKEKDED